VTLPEASVLSVTIANGQSLSTAAHIGTGTLVGLDIPTITSAALTFQVSVDGVTYRDALDSGGTEISIGASTGDRWRQAPSTLAGAPYIKVRSGTSGAPVSQGAQRVITLVVA
jgi:hypothetical protein